MGFVQNVTWYPRRLWVRRAMFQVHLWLGIAVSVYVAVIALSGAVLVFEDELTGTTLPPGLHAFEPGRAVGVEAVAARFARRFPGATLAEVTVPTRAVPAYTMRGTTAEGRAMELVADPVTAEPRVQGRSWVEWVHDLHLYLLLPAAYGAQVNGVGAAVLMVLALSGMALWWQGLRTWTRGLWVDLRRNWRRITFDLHSAIGFWTLLLVCWWAFSGFYFGFYQGVEMAVNRVFPIQNMMPPKALPGSGLAARVPLSTLLEQAQAASPAGRLYSVSDPLVRGKSVYASMDLRAAGDFAHRDIVLLDTGDGRVLSVWHYGERRSVGDWILWSMHPLHFGTLWGLGAKVIWAAAGVGLALLSVTGLMMYWNRYLRRRWRTLG